MKTLRYVLLLADNDARAASGREVASGQAAVRERLSAIQFYDKEFLEILKKQTPFAHLAVERPLPVGSVKLKLYGRES